MNNCFGESGLVIDYIKSLVKEKYRIVSNGDYYDSKTHFYLAKYLKELKNKGLNLFSMYNAFTSNHISDCSITAQGQVKYSRSATELCYIEVEPGDTLTFFIDCPVGVKIATGSYNGRKFIGSLQNVKCISALYESNPYVYQVPELSTSLTSFDQLYTDNLVVLVQLDKTISRKVALFGDYSNIIDNIVISYDAEAIWKEDEANITRLRECTCNQAKPNLDGLTKLGKQVAFDSCLIPYLMEYAITEFDEEIENIKRIQKAMSSSQILINLGMRYSASYVPGVLDAKQRLWLKELQLKYSTPNNNLNNKKCSEYNAIGRVSAELERLIMKDGINES